VAKSLLHSGALITPQWLSGLATSGGRTFVGAPYKMYLVIFSISTYPIGIIKFCECKTIHYVLLPCSTFIFIKLMLLVPRNRSWSFEVFVFLNTLVKDFRHCTSSFKLRIRWPRGYAGNGPSYLICMYSK
jgi:hypothetical protein